MKYAVAEREEIRRTFQVEADSEADAIQKAADHAQSRTEWEEGEEIVNTSHTFDVSEVV